MTREPLTLADVHPDRLYTAAEVAEVLGCAIDTVYRMGLTPRLPHTPLGPKGGRSKWLGRVILEYVQPKVA